MNYTYGRTNHFSMRPYEWSEVTATLTFDESEVPEGMTAEEFADKKLDELVAKEMREVRASTGDPQSFVHYYRPIEEEK